MSHCLEKHSQSKVDGARFQEDVCNLLFGSWLLRSVCFLFARLLLRMGGDTQGELMRVTAEWGCNMGQNQVGDQETVTSCEAADENGKRVFVDKRRRESRRLDVPHRRSHFRLCVCAESDWSLLRRQKRGSRIKDTGGGAWPHSMARPAGSQGPEGGGDPSRQWTRLNYRLKTAVRKLQGQNKQKEESIDNLSGVMGFLNSVLMNQRFELLLKPSIYFLFWK